MSLRLAPSCLSRLTEFGVRRPSIPRAATSSVSSASNPSSASPPRHDSSPLAAHCAADGLHVRTDPARLEALGQTLIGTVSRADSQFIPSINKAGRLRDGGVRALSTWRPRIRCYLRAHEVPGVPDKREKGK